MSVINKMLQDLEKRQQGHSLSNVAVHQAQYLGRPNPSRKWLVISLVSLLVGGLSVYAFQASYGVKSVADNNVNPVASAQTQVDNASPQTDTSPLETEATKSTDTTTPTEPTVEMAQVSSSSTDAPTKDMSVSAESISSVVQSARVNAAPAEPRSEQTTESIAANTSSNTPNKAALTQESVQTQAESQQVAVKANQADVNANQSEVKIIQTEPKTSESVVPVATQASSQASSPASAQAQATGQMAIREVKLSPSQLAQKQLVLAADAEKQGQLVKVMDYYAKALKLDPSLHESRKQLAALHYGQGELAQAAEVLAQGRLLYPQEFEFALLLARVQHAMGETDSALASLAQIPDSHSLARQKWLAQTDLAQKHGQYPLVEQAYRKLLQQEPQQGKWWMGLAYALDSQQQFGPASQAYRTALSYSGLSTQATAFIEQRLQQLGDSQ